MWDPRTLLCCSPIDVLMFYSGLTLLEYLNNDAIAELHVIIYVRPFPSIWLHYTSHSVIRHIYCISFLNLKGHYQEICGQV